jgi:hypothetical protein
MASITLGIDIDGLENSELNSVGSKVEKVLRGEFSWSIDVEETDREEDEDDDNGADE